jgi:hypothetical protein
MSVLGTQTGGLIAQTLFVQFSVTLQTPHSNGAGLQVSLACPQLKPWSLQFFGTQAVHFPSRQKDCLPHIPQFTMSRTLPQLSAVANKLQLLLVRAQNCAFVSGVQASTDASASGASACTSGTEESG